MEWHSGMVKMKKIDKSERIDYIEPIHDKPTRPNGPKEELGFMLWKAELNKELMSFWKSLIMDEDEEN